MKVLFSPSEGKQEGGVTQVCNDTSFMFKKLYDKRIEIIHKYNNFIKAASDEELSKLFGIKDFAKLEKYKTDLFSQPTMKVIERYNGIAFNYLDYLSLDNNAKDYLDNNVIIFSNLFGPILAGDNCLPNYKLKQGEKINGFALEAYYKKEFSAALDDLLSNEVFVDLRAGFYTKFYKPTSPYITLKFLKQGKVVSHWAKAYRGLVLRELSNNNITSLGELLKMDIVSLSITEVITKGIHTEIVYAIID